MAEIFSHRFKDGSIIRVIEKKFPAAEKQIPTFMFQFRHENRNMTLEAPLYDVVEKSDLIPELYKSLGEFLGAKKVEKVEEPDTVQVTLNVGEELEEPKKADNPSRLVKEKTCADCGTVFAPASNAQKVCNPCRIKRKKGTK
jgi:hypothetical protein